MKKISVAAGGAVGGVRRGWIRSHREHVAQAARVSLAVGPVVLLVNNFDVSLYSSTTGVVRRGTTDAGKERP